MPNYNDHEALKGLGREIARLLGSFWILDEENDWTHCAVIKGQEGAAIHIRPTRTPAGRLSISGNYPQGRHFCNDLDRPRITVTDKKDAAAIVKDIRRRFLPKYLETYRAEKDCKQEYEENEELRHRRLRQLAKTLHSDNRNGRVYMPRRFSGYGTFEMQEGNAENVKISLSSVPFDMALKVAQLLIEEITS